MVDIRNTRGTFNFFVFLSFIFYLILFDLFNFLSFLSSNRSEQVGYQLKKLLKEAIIIAITIHKEAIRICRLHLRFLKMAFLEEQ